MKRTSRPESGAPTRPEAPMKPRHVDGEHAAALAGWGLLLEDRAPRVHEHRGAERG